MTRLSGRFIPLGQRPHIATPKSLFAFSLHPTHEKRTRALPENALPSSPGCDLNGPHTLLWCRCCVRIACPCFVQFRSGTFANRHLFGLVLPPLPHSFRAGLPIEAPLSLYHPIYVLPAPHPAAVGRACTGITPAVPSMEPIDLYALGELKQQATLRVRLGLCDEWVLPYNPVPVMDVRGEGQRVQSNSDWRHTLSYSKHQTCRGERGWGRELERKGEGDAILGHKASL